LQIGTPTGKGDSGAGAGGKKDDNNSWRTPLVKKKRDKSKHLRARKARRDRRGNNARLAYVLQVYQPNYNRISKLCHMAKQRKLWANHWGNTAFTVEIPENNSQQGKKVRYIQMVQTHGSVQLASGRRQSTE
jgi:hypothetical protein